jgi:hypothetical protein
MKYAFNQIDTNTYEVVWDQSGYTRTLTLVRGTDNTLIGELQDPEKLENFVKVLKSNVNDNVSNDQSNYSAAKLAYTNSSVKFDKIKPENQIEAFTSASYSAGTLTFTKMGGDTLQVTGFSTNGGTTPVTNIVSTTDSAGLTGTTANTKVRSVPIPANTIAVGDLIFIRVRARKTGTAGALVQRLYINTSDAIGGSLIGTGANMANTGLYQQVYRTLAVKSSTVTETMQAGAGANADDVVLTGAVANSNIDWTQNQYLIIAHQNVSSGDTSLNSFYHIQILKA